jgi:hypothetical protein
MAVIQVNLTSESFHHLMQIVEAAIDTKVIPIAVKPTFRPLVKALYQMVILTSTTPSIAAPTEGAVAGALQITLPRALTVPEQAMETSLKNMEDACAQSITDTNAGANYKLVLEV